MNRRKFLLTLLAVCASPSLLLKKSKSRRRLKCTWTVMSREELREFFKFPLSPQVEKELADSIADCLIEAKRRGEIS